MPADGRWVNLAIIAATVALVVAALRAESGRRAASAGGRRDLVALLTSQRPQMYGAAWCGATRRQLAELTPEELAAVTVVDCGAGGCEGVRALPTWELLGGARIEGYHPREALTAELVRAEASNGAAA